MSSDPLSPYQWHHRLLLVFTPSSAAEAYVAQRSDWNDHLDGTADRDLLLVELIAGEPGRLNGEPLDDTAAAALRSRFQVPDDTFTVILVGKDGTEKSRSVESVVMENIFAQIDRMPMRRREMRERDGGA